MWYWGKWSESVPIHFPPLFWTIFAYFVSWFLGGLWGIQGPIIIIHLLHLPCPIRLPNKKLQISTGAAINLTNVTMRFIYHLINILTLNITSFFFASEWGIYAFTPIFSMSGVMDGANLSNFIKDNQNTIKEKLRILLVFFIIRLLIYSLAAIL